MERGIYIEVAGRSRIGLNPRRVYRRRRRRVVVRAVVRA